MADNTSNNNGGVLDPQGYFSNQTNTSDNNNTSKSYNSNSEIEYLKSIDATLKRLLSQGSNMSQSSARDSMYSREDFRNRERNRRDNTWYGGSYTRGRNNSIASGFQEGLMEALLGSDFKDKMSESINEFADAFGLDLHTIQNDLGKELGKQAAEAFRGTKFGQDISDHVGDMANKAFDNMKSKFAKGVKDYDSKFNWDSGQQDFSSRFKNMSNKASNAAESGLADAAASAVNVGADTIGTVEAASSIAGLAEGASGAGALLSGLGAVIPEVAVAFAAVTAATLLLDAAMDAFTPAIEGAKKALESASTSMNRSANSREKNLKLAQERMEADIKTMVEIPFKILEDAANELYESWDTNIRKINGTQGYSKDDLHSLMSSYAERLRNDGLSGVVSSADITDNLAKVLDSGLSGYAAEEFSYLATVLNAAVPTQDFFGYADEYASLAGTMIAQGKSEQEAISYANSQLEAFANNILYAGRNLSGGFTTGLQNASDLLEDSIKIAQSAKTGNVDEISGVLTSVQSIVGSVAPDLASSITDSVVKAAIGGNSSEIVALRSLSGVNASNTEFLKALANDPQSIFSTLFNNLANLQNMSNDASMEVAEGLSSVFGISMDAFARIDFNYLASAISNMDVNSGSLQDNIALLASGQTTTNAEILRNQQINQYMIEEGLSLVLDSEAGRAIQQHMWNEQIARDLMESTYAVELTGSALEFLEGIKGTVTNILGFLNPIMLIGKTIQLAGTANEYAAQKADIQKVLEATKVGNGRMQDLYNLTTTNADLHLTKNLAELLTGSSAYSTASKSRKIGAALYGIDTSNIGAGTLLRDASGYTIASMAASNLANSSSGMRKSSYTWGTIGKSQVNSAYSGRSAALESLSTVSSKQASAEAAQEAANKALANKMNSVVNLMSSTDKSGKLKYASYDEWKSTASKKVKDWDSALEAAGYSESQLEQHFQDLQTQQAAIEQQKRLEDEADFWQAGKDFWRADEFRTVEFEFWEITKKYQTDELEMTTNIFDLLSETTNKILTDLNKELKSLHQDWTDYYINYKVYGTGEGELNSSGRQTYSYSDVASVAAKEKEESYDAVHALAEALNKNIVDLHDPQVQTNAILGRILLVAEAILQQEQAVGGGGTSTLDTLTSLATGKLTK